MSFSVPTSKWVDLMPKEEWIECVKVGVFIPDDGTGYWGNETGYDNHSCAFDPAPEGATHVHWFNK